METGTVPISNFDAKQAKNLAINYPVLRLNLLLSEIEKVASKGKRVLKRYKMPDGHPWATSLSQDVVVKLCDKGFNVSADWNNWAISW